ncbi:MAG: ROK family protein [Chitinophagaceae bacterium]
MNLIGIDLGGTRIKIGIVVDGRLLISSVINADPENGLHLHLPLIKECILQLIRQTCTNDIHCIGMAFPGLVDTDKNQIISSRGKYEDAPALDLASWAFRELGMTLQLENDARLACLGEWKYGAGQENADMVMVTLGTGFGSAAIINGKLLRGKHFQAGILGGHFIISFKDKDHLCSCGNYGCVEAVASTWMIKEAARQSPFFEKSGLKEASRIDLETIFDMAKQGDELARLLQNHCLEAWGIGLINLIHAYDPEVIVIGGGISNASETLIPYFNQMIAEKAWCPWGQPNIRRAQFPDTAAILGAALLFEA